MSMRLSKQTNVLILGLDSGLRDELKSALHKDDPTVRTTEESENNDCSGEIARLQPDIVFCPATSSCFKQILEVVRKVHPGLPVVVVSRFPEVSEWLDAMDAGASDYFASPFEPVQVRWILESNLPRPCTAAA
jgi:two-component system, response regulator FlrC